MGDGLRVLAALWAAGCGSGMLGYGGEDPVQPERAVPSCEVSVVPPAVALDEAQEIRWEASGAGPCSLSYDGGSFEPVDCLGSVWVVPGRDGIDPGEHRIDMAVSGEGSEATCGATQVVRPEVSETLSAPPSCDLALDPEEVALGEACTASWRGTAGSCAMRLDGGSWVPVPCEGAETWVAGEADIAPGDHLLELSVRGDGGAAQCEAGLTVLEPGVPGGLVTGSARVTVSGLPSPPTADKGVIFCLTNADTGFWVNVRHRSREGVGSYFQLKGAFDEDFSCGAEVNYWVTQPACDGAWTVEWDGTTGEVTVGNPCGSETLWLGLGPFTVTGVLEGASCGGYIGWGAGAAVTVEAFEGVEGMALPCGG